MPHSRLSVPRPGNRRASADLRESLPVLVVIPTLNERLHIATLLDRLLRDRLFTSRRLRLVVADGGSTDGTREIVEAYQRAYPEVRLLDNPLRIQSAGVNEAVRRFGHGAEFLIRVDAHAEYPRDYCAMLLATAERERADAVVVPLDSHGSQALQKAVAWVSNSRIGTGGAAHRAGRRSGFVEHGHHALFRMESFLRAGGYDESLACNEDAELDCRQIARGARLYLDASIRVTYHPRASLSALFRQYFGYGAGRSRTARRHPSSLRFRQLLVPLHLVVFLLGGLLFAWGEPLGAVYPVVYLGCLVVASALIAFRERSAAGLLAGPVAFVLHTAWGLGFLLEWIRVREAPWRPERTVALEFAEGEVNG